MINKQELSIVQLIDIVSELMPKGEPDFKALRAIMPIQTMIDKGVAKKSEIRAILCVIIKNFSDSINVVRNLNEVQMIDIAQMLIDECGDFRIEDYLMMFQMAKRGKIGDIRDRIDIQVVSRLIDEYWSYRSKKGKELQELQDVEAAEKRKEEKRLMLGSGKQVTISAEQIQAEISAIEKAMKDNIDAHTVDVIKQNEIRKNMLKQRAIQAFGLDEGELERYQTYTATYYQSKANKNNSSEKFGNSE